MPLNLLARRTDRLDSHEPSARPLVVTADEVILEEVLRLCAAAGVTPVVAADVGAARTDWSRAPLVLVGDDLAGRLAVAAPARRPAVAVVTTDATGAAVWERAVALGADQVFAVPVEQERVIEALANCLDARGTDATVVSVVGGCGGAGASCLAGAIALLAAEDERATLLVDADPLGGGIDMVLGNEDVRGLRWPDLASTEGRVSGDSLRRALPQLGGLSLLSWDRGDVLSIPAESMRTVLAAARRALDVVVVDTPRRFDAATEEALARSATTLLLVPAEVRAIAAAARLLRPLRELSSDVRLVVRGPGPSGIAPDVVADTLELPLAAQMRTDRRLGRAVDEGLGPPLRRRGAIARAARTLLDDICGSPR